MVPKTEAGRWFLSLQGHPQQHTFYEVECKICIERIQRRFKAEKLGSWRSTAFMYFNAPSRVAFRCSASCRLFPGPSIFDLMPSLPTSHQQQLTLLSLGTKATMGHKSTQQLVFNT